MLTERFKKTAPLKEIVIVCLPKIGFKKCLLFLFDIFKSKSSMDLNYLVMRLILLPNLHKDAPVNENANIWTDKLLILH